MRRTSRKRSTSHKTRKSRKTTRKKDNINKTVHQVYGIFDDGVPLRDIDVFYKNVLKTKAFCDKYKLKYKMWNLSKCTKLINSHFKKYKTLWNDFIKGPTGAPIMRADFIRYCILYKYGGIYIDCDIHPIKKIDHLFSKDYFFVRWNDDKKNLPYNAVMGGKKNEHIYKEIMEHCKESFYEKRKQSIYKKWKGRFVFQTTGHYMIHRVLKNNKVPLSNILDVLKIHTKSGKVVQGNNPLFEDANASMWFEGKK